MKPARSRRLLPRLALLGILAWSARADTTIAVGDLRQLFLDDLFFASSRGVALVVHPPQKTGAPVLTAEEPRYTGISGYATVLYVDGLYQMWYAAATAIGGELAKNAPDAPDADYPVRLVACYARSRDGVHWKKPRLGLAHDFPHGEPNVVIGNGAGGYPEDGAAGPVTLNPHPGPDDRFLMPVITQVRSESRLQLNLLASGDGIHWHTAARNIVTHRPGEDQLDTNNVIFWDDRIGKWVAYVRRNLYFPWGRSRATARAESADVTHFPLVEDLPVVFAWDDRDPALPGGTGDNRVRLVDYYTNVTAKYPWADRAYFQFPSAFFHYTAGYEPEFPAHAPKNHGPIDIRFAASRDGITWERYDRRAFVSLGLHGAWDGKTLYMVHGILPGATEGEIYLYYRGSDALHGWTRSRADVEQVTAAGLAPASSLSGIARLVLRRDGFVSARGDYEGGEFTSPPLEFSGDELVLNIDTSAGGEARVELLDAAGAPLPGFTLAEADRIHTANNINRRVSWRGRSSVGTLAGRPVRLHVLLRDADLYAFQFRTTTHAR
ncbi:MAG TPA: hypothetical protein VHD61_11130 [Lacunisphaera sp.]|nr:hypothetical protein [Lacunisphaera sp.]